MKKLMAVHKLSLFGSYNESSIGDRAILVSLLNLLFSESKFPLFIQVICFDKGSIWNEIRPYEWSSNVEIVSLSDENLPSNSKTNNTGSVKKIYKLLPRSVRNILITLWYSLRIQRTTIFSESEGLIIGGGNLLMDLFPRWPAILFFLTRKCYNAGLPVIFAGVGALPLRTIIGKLLIKETVRKASLVFVRDQKTQEYLVKNWNITAQCHPDFALSFPIDNDNISAQKRELSVAVNFAPVFSKWWPYQDNKKYECFLDGISRYLYNYYLFTDSKISFWFYDTNLSDQVGTEELIKRLQELGLPGKHIYYERALNSSAEIIQKLSTKRFAVTTRLHAGLLALRAGTPTISVVYQPKVRNVYHNIGLTKGIVDISEISRISTLFDEINAGKGDFSLSPSRLSDLDRANRVVIEEILKTIFKSTR